MVLVGAHTRATLLDTGGVDSDGFSVCVGRCENASAFGRVCNSGGGDGGDSLGVGGDELSVGLGSGLEFGQDGKSRLGG